MNANHKTSLTWWSLPRIFTAIVVVVLLFPILLPVLAVLAVYKLTILTLIWILWLPQGKNVLVIYSDSPHWQSYFESIVIPQLGKRCLTLNWSERKTWNKQLRLPQFAFSAFSGSREFNPAIIVFKLWRWPRHFAFYKAFRDFKHGNQGSLENVLEDLSAYLGELVPTPPRPSA